MSLRSIDRARSAERVGLPKPARGSRAGSAQHWAWAMDSNGFGSVSVRVARWAAVGILVGAQLLTGMSSALAVSSSVSSPAGGSYSPAGESSGAGAAAKAVPANYARAPAGKLKSGGMQAMSFSAGATGASQTAKFVLPDTPYNGAFARSFSIEVPPFYAITPKLPLDYSTGNTRLRAEEGFSPLGVGWTRNGGSVIKRTSSSGGVPSFTSSDVYVLDDY